MATKTRPPVISQRYIQTAVGRLAQNQRVRRHLPLWGRLHIDRQLQFLCVYRRPVAGDDGETAKLITSQASYLFASASRQIRESLHGLVHETAATLSRVWGGFLILEIWVEAGNGAPEDVRGVKPAFRIVAPKNPKLSSTIEVLEEALRKTTILKQSAEVEVVSASKVAPPGLAPLLSPTQLATTRCHIVGLEVEPVYRNEQTGQFYPLVFRALRRQLYRALERTFFEFARSNTTADPSHYHALGRRALVKAVWAADRGLAEVSDAFDFLLQVTPVNTEQAWAAFKRGRFERMPEFLYRPRTVAPSLLKRSLYAVPLERVEDPVIAQLFQEKQAELDRQLTMLLDRETSRFVYGSLQLFGGVDDTTLRLAEALLNDLPSRTRDDSTRDVLDATMLAQRAEEEIGWLRETYPELSARVEVRDDIHGLMVSRGNLLIGDRTKIPATRAEALMQHEVGTHVLTYHNGRAQPLKQLYAGLAGYEELQEGLAVLAEYLVGGLSRPRLRLLAARVVAVRRMIDGASFVEAFRELDRSWDFSSHTAFIVTLRAFRGGGLTKDAVYLRGLRKLLRYLGGGGSLEPLLVGKISAMHVPIIQELLLRKVLRPAPMRPRYLKNAAALDRLERARRAISILELVKEKQK